MRRLPIIDYEGLYEISDDGRVFSLDRNVIGANGATYPFKGKELAQTNNKQTNCMTVSLWENNIGKTYSVHRLVANAFIPNSENKPEVNHINGDRKYNHVSNLAWVTSSENKIHAIKTGLKVYTNRLTKIEFIDCLQSVIDGESYYNLSLRVPYQVPFLSTKIRKIAKELGVEYLLNDSLLLQRQKRARINGAKTARKN